MKINCLSCGHNIDLDEAYAENYDGRIKCFACNAILELRTEQSSIRYVRFPEPAAHNANTNQA
jgi:hypothetical protein